MAMIDINYWAVLVSAIVSMLIGAFWYSPAGFGKAWMQLMGIGKKDMDKATGKGMGSRYFMMFVGTLVMVYVLAYFVNYAGASDIMAGLQAGFWAWLGFIAPIMLSSVLWEGKPWKLYWINVTHYLVVLLVSGAILAAWH